MLSQLQRNLGELERHKGTQRPTLLHRNPVIGRAHGLPWLQLKEKPSSLSQPQQGTSGQKTLLWLEVQTPGAGSRPQGQRVLLSCPVGSWVPGLPSTPREYTWFKPHAEDTRFIGAGEFRAGRGPLGTGVMP